MGNPLQMHAGLPVTLLPVALVFQRKNRNDWTQLVTEIRSQKSKPSVAPTEVLRAVIREGPHLARTCHSSGEHDRPLPLHSSRLSSEVELPLCGRNQSVLRDG